MISKNTLSSRRAIIKLLAAMPLLTSSLPLIADSNSKISLRKVPSSGELIPSVGMGSYQTFNITKDSSQHAALLAVLNAFFSAGGKLIDSSPMYGKSESVLGDLMSKIKPKPDVFAASKVWTFGENAGLNAISESRSRMQVSRLDLMQVHNLRDWKVQLNSLNRLKSQGDLRYTGITTSFLGQYEQFEQVMANQKLDFVQLNYNIKVREAEKRLLPLAQEKGIGVIVNMPFEKGRLFKFVRGKKLPDWAVEFDCFTWGQFFLKFILSHPAVTCVIPATSKVAHMKDNMQAMTGRLPSKKMRQKMLQFFDSI